MPIEPSDVGDAGEPAVVEGVKGEWRVDPALLDGRLRGPHRAAVAVRPADPRPGRTQELFDFEYTLEMYKPAAQAALGLLRAADPPRRPAGREARRAADRKAGVLRVNAIHEDVTFTRAVAKAVQAELDDLAAWLGLTLG